MKVTVKLYTILKKYGKGKIDKDNYVRLPVFETIQGLIRYLGIPEKLGKVYLVNDIPRNGEYTLSDGDEVKILAFIGGGWRKLGFEINAQGVTVSLKFWFCNANYHVIIFIVVMKYIFWGSHRPEQNKIIGR